MKIFFDEQTVEIELSEMPGRKIIFEGLAMISEEVSKTKIIETLVSKVDVDYFAYKIDRLFVPKLQGVQEI